MGTKARKFSIYLLKKECKPAKALAGNTEPLQPLSSSLLPSSFALHKCKHQDPIPPWWPKYLGVEPDDFKREAGNSILAFVSVKVGGRGKGYPSEERVFVLTFGHAWRCLNLNCCESDFGFRVASKSIERSKLKNVAVSRMGSSLRVHAQANDFSDLAAFGLREDRNKWRSVAGAAADEHAKYFHWTFGKDLILQCRTRLGPRELHGLLQKLADLYRMRKYKSSFPEADRIIAVTNSELIERLDKKLLGAIRKTGKGALPIFALPEEIDPEEQESVRMMFLKHEEEPSAIDLSSFNTCIKNSGINREKISLVNLKNDGFVKILMEDGNALPPLPFYNCFVFTTDIGKETYFLNNGAWYNMDQSFMEETRKLIINSCGKAVPLRDYDDCCEDAYNKSVTGETRGMVCLHGKRILREEWLEGRRTNIELCDLFLAEKGRPRVLIHVKIPRSASSYSHLFQQGLVAAEVLREKPEAMNNLNNILKEEKIDRMDKYDGMEVVLAIITDKPTQDKSAPIPLFSWMSFRHMLRAFDHMGIKVTLQYVKNMKRLGKGTARKRKKCAVCAKKSENSKAVNK